MSNLFGTQNDPAPVLPPSPEGTPAAGSTPPVQATENLFADQLAGITAEDGRQKYADVPTALASIPHAQTRIQELTQKVTEMETELSKQKGADELIEQLRAANTPTTPPSGDVNAAELSTLVEQIMQQKQTATTAVENQKKVSDTLTNAFGDKAMSTLESKATELGLGMDGMMKLASSSPAAVLAFFGQDNPASNADPIQSGSIPPNLSTPPTVDRATEAYNNLMGDGDTLTKKWKQSAIN